jgi:hypothetical protein
MNGISDFGFWILDLNVLIARLAATRSGAILQFDVRDAI